MKALMPFMATVSLLFLISSGSSALANDADTFRRFGMIGVWAQDCSKQPANDNPYMTYAASMDGRVTNTLNAAVTIESQIVAASILSSDLLQYHLVNKNGPTFVLVVRKTASEYQVISNVRERTLITSEGRNLSNGRQTSIFKKCRDS